MRKRVFAILPVLLVILVFCPSALSSADAVPAAVQIENRQYNNGTLSFDARLSRPEGQPDMSGQLAVIVYGEDKRLKDSVFYSVAETVHVASENVADTDRVNAIWLDSDLCPIAEPASLLMDRTDAEASTQFADRLVKLLGHSGGAGAETADSSNPYALAR